MPGFAAGVRGESRQGRHKYRDYGSFGKRFVCEVPSLTGLADHCSLRSRRLILVLLPAVPRGLAHTGGSYNTAGRLAPRCPECATPFDTDNLPKD